MRKLRYREIYLCLSALSVCLCRRVEHRTCCDEPNRYVPVLMGAYKSHGTHRPYTSKPQTHDHTTYKEGTGFGEREYPRRREGSHSQGSLLWKSDSFKAETWGTQMSQSDDTVGEVTGRTAVWKPERCKSLPEHLQTESRLVKSNVTVKKNGLTY